TDIGFFGGGDVGIAAAADLHLDHGRIHIGDIDVARASYIDSGVLEFAVGLDRAGASDRQFQPVLIQAVQRQVAAAGDAELLEGAAGEGDGQVVTRIVPVAAIQLDPAVAHA